MFLEPPRPGCWGLGHLAALPRGHRVGGHLILATLPRVSAQSCVPVPTSGYPPFYSFVLGRL